MGWDGAGNVNRNNGTFTGSQVWQQDRDAAVKIRADRHDLHDEDIATAIENTVARDGQNAALANLPMGGFRHTNVGNSSARNMYAATGQVQDQSFTYVASVTGTADAIVLTPVPAITTYAAGQLFSFRATGTNTGAVTVNVSALGTRAVQKLGAALVAGDITLNDVVELRYDGTQFQMLSPARTPVLTDGSIPKSKISGGLTDVQTFTNSGTWTKPVGAVSVIALVWSAGGSGSTATSTNRGNAGGGGGFDFAVFRAADLGATVSVTVGAGGAAVVTDNTIGNVGGSSSFGTLISVTGGGNGGNPAGNSGGKGGGVSNSVGVDFNGGAAGSSSAGGTSKFGGGGGAGGTAANPGGNSEDGGGGGGNAVSTGFGAAGTSTRAGNGGAGNNAGNATAGGFPSGGGGGAHGAGNQSGAGGNGRVIVISV